MSKAWLQLQVRTYLQVVPRYVHVIR